MKLKDLYFEFPENLIATEPKRPSRVLWVGRAEDAKNPSQTDAAMVAKEISIADLMSGFRSGDVLVINNTKVLKRRVFAGDLEILFLESSDQRQWQILFPSRRFKVGDVIDLPLGHRMTIKEKGRPQVVTLDRPLTESYFAEVGELPLPPYIQKMRQKINQSRHSRGADESWYQTAWARQPGSFAAPTASLHFSSEDLARLRKVGVEIAEVTLHVGLGTFLPVTAEDLDQHEMHSELTTISGETWRAIEVAKKQGRRIWSLGTTAARAVESAAGGLLKQSFDGGFSGSTNLLIQPGYQWQIVDLLLTNFHQPESTLLALVAGFAGLENMHRAYRYAIEKKFRLFSYGDLSVWERMRAN